MRIKRRSIFLAAIAALAVCIAVITVSVFLPKNKFENDSMVVTWQEGIGKPLVVEGIVLSQGMPVVGRTIDIETGSGGNPVSTGVDGTFSVNAGELELVALKVDGAGRVDWGLFGGPSLRDGVRFRIELK